MKRKIVSAFTALALTAATFGVTVTTTQQPAAAQEDLPWMNTGLPAKQRTELLLDAMTLDQKLEQIFNKPVYNEDLDDGDQSNGKGCDFTLVGRHIEGIPALAIPDFRMANGGTGIRGGDCLPSRPRPRCPPRSPRRPPSTGRSTCGGVRCSTVSCRPGRTRCSGARS